MGYSAWCGQAQRRRLRSPADAGEGHPDRVQGAPGRPAGADPLRHPQGPPVVGHAVGEHGRGAGLGRHGAAGPDRHGRRHSHGRRRAVRARGAGTRSRPSGTPAQWALRKDAQRNAALRPAPAPAPTISFGHAAGEMRLGPAYQPGPAARRHTADRRPDDRARARADSKIRWPVGCQVLPQQQQQRVRTVN